MTTPAARQILNDVFGYAAFRGEQQAIVEHVVAGGDALVLMPTGGGKSLCYQIPALLRPGVGIVVSPLIALMQDQVDALCQLGVKAAFLNSSIDADTVREVQSRLLRGELDLLYVAPERLMMDSFLNLLERLYNNTPSPLHPQGVGRGCKAAKAATTTLHGEGWGGGRDSAYPPSYPHPRAPSLRSPPLQGGRNKCGSIERFQFVTQ